MKVIIELLNQYARLIAQALGRVLLTQANKTQCLIFLLAACGYDQKEYRALSFFMGKYL